MPAITRQRLMKGPMRTIGEGRIVATIMFVACLLFFNWPLISLADGAFGKVINLFFFWAAAIVGLRIYAGYEIKQLEKSTQKDK
jgi:hypothetical protein